MNRQTGRVALQWNDLGMLVEAEGDPLDLLDLLTLGMVHLIRSFAGGDEDLMDEILKLTPEALQNARKMDAATPMVDVRAMREALARGE